MWTALTTVAIGYQPPDIVQSFLTPIPVQPGEFVALVCKNITVPAAGQCGALLTIEGYWE
jgi:hypothetical protein